MKCVFCSKKFNKQEGKKYCSPRCREKQWQKLHPIRWKRHQLNYRKSKRKPCKECGVKLLFGTPGRVYCEKCSAVVRAVKKKAAIKKRWIKYQEYKTKKGCSKCGYSRYPEALDFHHKKREDKKSRVWTLYGKEFNKCVVLCANCHRHETFKKE